MRIIAGFQMRKVWRAEARASEMLNAMKECGVEFDTPDWLKVHDIISKNLQGVK